MPRNMSISEHVPTPNGEVLTTQNIDEIRSRGFDGINKERNTSWSDKDYQEFEKKRDLQEVKQKAKKLNWNFNLDIQNPEQHAKLILKANPLYYDKNKRWWRWDLEQQYWKETFEPEIINFIKQIFEAQGMSSSYNRTTILNALKDETQNNKPKQPKETWLQIGKKIYDIASNEEIEPKPKYFIKTIIPHEMGESEETPFIDQLFKDWKPEIITGEDSFEVLKEITAYAMSPKQFLESFYFMQGLGSDGKSVFLNLLTLMVGDIDDEENKHINTYHGSLEILTDPKQRFETITLKNKLLAILGDGNFGVIKNSKMLKEASGNTEKIRGEIKGVRDKQDFYNQAKLMCAFNTLPETNDKTKGFYRRCHLTFWHEEFSGKRNIITELKNEHFHEINNLLKRNLRILREMYKRNSIKGMYGADDWTKTKEIYEQHSNPLKQFRNAEMNENMKGCFSAGKFHKEYSSWAEQNGFNSFTFKEAEQRLKSSNMDYMKTWVYQMPDGMLFRDKEKAFNYWKSLIKEPKADEYLFEKEISKDYLKVFRGFSFKKQDFEPNETKTTTFQIANSNVKKPVQKVVSKGSMVSKPNNLDSDDIILTSSEDKQEDKIKREGIKQAIREHLRNDTAYHIDDIISQNSLYSERLIRSEIAMMTKCGELMEISPDYYKLVV